MQRKIFRLIATDFFCWVPVSILAFYIFSGSHGDKGPWIDFYYVAGTILLPINSALNPILYSDVLDKLFARIRCRCCSKT